MLRQGLIVHRPFRLCPSYLTGISPASSSLHPRLITPRHYYHYDHHHHRPYRLRLRLSNFASPSFRSYSTRDRITVQSETPAPSPSPASARSPPRARRHRQRQPSGTRNSTPALHISETNFSTSSNSRSAFQSDSCYSPSATRRYSTLINTFVKWKTKILTKLPEKDSVENEQESMAPAKTEVATEDAYGRVFNTNSTWRRSLAETNPELFEKLGKGQAPQILWIGCADSRCPETTILGLQPGEIFCHRNIANILVPTDINSLSVIQYAVQYLKVKHIIICGHTSCGGIAAALDNKKLGLIDTWLMPLRTLRRENLELLQHLDEKERGLKLVELNVRSGVNVLLENPIVIDAISERGLQVHGLIYNVGTGELRELDIEEEAEVVKSRKTAFKTD